MSESEEIMIYKALFCSKYQQRRVEVAKKLLNIGMKIDIKHFRAGNETRAAFRIKRKLLKFIKGNENV